MSDPFDFGVYRGLAKLPASARAELAELFAGDFDWSPEDSRPANPNPIPRFIEILKRHGIDPFQNGIFNILRDQIQFQIPTTPEALDRRHLALLCETIKRLGLKGNVSKADRAAIRKRCAEDPHYSEIFRLLDDAGKALAARDFIPAAAAITTAQTLLYAGKLAAIGRKMDPREASRKAAASRKARGTRAKKPSPLRAAVSDAWEDYREDSGDDATKTGFVDWLFNEGDIYDIEASRLDEEFRKAGEAVKGETIRKNWLK